MWKAGILKRLRTAAKNSVRLLRRVYVRRFRSFTPDDLLHTLRRLGIERGDILCVHSSYNAFDGFTGNAGDVLRILKEAVGPEGGLMMPTQPFSGSAIDYAREHPVTNLAKAPSQVGLITELLRRLPSAVRTIHPTHPVALWGARGTGLAGDDWAASTPCGTGTAYHRLFENDGKILMLGTSLQPMTFFHFAEAEIAPITPFNPYTEEIYELQSLDRAGKLYVTRTRLFERSLGSRRRMARMVPELKRLGGWKEARVGTVSMILVKAVDVVKACRNMAERGEFCYDDPPEAPRG